jgi:hypothetical protein
MTTVIFNPPPDIDVSHGLGPCLACLMCAKGAQVEATRESWQAAIRDGDDTGLLAMPYPVNSPAADAPRIWDAIVVGLCDMFPTMLAPVCWTHLAAISPPNPEPLCKWCGGRGTKADAGIQAARGSLPPSAFKNGSHRHGGTGAN